MEDYGWHPAFSSASTGFEIETREQYSQLKVGAKNNPKWEIVSPINCKA